MKKQRKPRYKVHINIEPDYKNFLLGLAKQEDLALATYLRRLIKQNLHNNWREYEKNRV